MKELNRHFAPAGFSFTFNDVTKTINTNWTIFRDEWIVKSTLRRGDYNTLNLYYVKGELQDIAEDRCETSKDPETKGHLGWCNYPTAKVLQEDSWFVYDGCFVSGDTVPDGSLKDRNTGKMTVHEVGHWFGLMHTFQNDDKKGCDGLGDAIDDIPAQILRSKDCNMTQDSCPGQPGLDPANNFMGYANE